METGGRIEKLTAGSSTNQSVLRAATEIGGSVLTRMHRVTAKESVIRLLGNRGILWMHSPLVLVVDCR